MSQFWLIAALLMCVAAFFVLWPALRVSSKVEDVSGDQEGFLLDLFNENRKELEEQLQAGEITQAEFEQLSSELEQGLLQDVKEQQANAVKGGRAPLLVFAVLVVIGAVVFYQQRGALPDVAVQELMAERYQQSIEAFQRGEEPDSAVTEELIAVLSERVNGVGDQSENRYLLARLAAEHGRYGLAVEQYTTLLQGENKEDPRLMAELAQVVFLASGNRITPEVSLLVRKTLELNPQETTALGLAGIEAYEKALYETAIEYWQTAIAAMPPGTPVIRGMEVGIERARAMLADSGVVNEGQLETPVETPDSPAVITIQASVAEGVNVPGDAVVMVYAREWGGRMPLAINRFSASELPKEITLDESMSMMPGANIGTVEKLELVVRISKSGGAVPQSGDWQVSMGPLELSGLAEPVSMVVKNQLP